MKPVKTGIAGTYCKLPLKRPPPGHKPLINFVYMPLPNPPGAIRCISPGLISGSLRQVSIVNFELLNLAALYFHLKAPCSIFTSAKVAERFKIVCTCVVCQFLPIFYMM